MRKPRRAALLRAGLALQAPETTKRKTDPSGNLPVLLLEKAAFLPPARPLCPA